MSSFRTFALVGAGNLGVYIVEELLKQKQAGKATDVVLLTRPSSKNENIKRLASQGARIVAVDYVSEDSLTSALKGIDVVISTVPNAGLGYQLVLISAAKKAGVRLFLPSEFGNPTDGAQADFHKLKQQPQQKLKELDLPYLLVFTGPWSDYFFVPALLLDIAHGKATVGGDGNTPISFTSRRDIARFLAYVLRTLPPDRLSWKTLRIEGERISFNEIFKQYAAKTGKKIDVTYKSIDELEAIHKAHPQVESSGVPEDDSDAHTAYLHLTFAQGKGVVGKPEEVSNGLYPDWNPQKVVDAIL